MSKKGSNPAPPGNTTKPPPPPAPPARSVCIIGEAIPDPLTFFANETTKARQIYLDANNLIYKWEKEVKHFKKVGSEDPILAGMSSAYEECISALTRVLGEEYSG